MTFETGDVELVSGEKIEGFTGWRGLVHPLSALGIHWFDSQFYLRVGVADNTEIGILAGVQEIGAEVRTAIFDEDAGDSASLAVSGAAMWRPFMDLKTPWFRAGFDVSRRDEAIVAAGESLPHLWPRDPRVARARRAGGGLPRRSGRRLS